MFLPCNQNFLVAEAVLWLEPEKRGGGLRPEAAVPLGLLALHEWFAVNSFALLSCLAYFLCFDSTILVG